MRSSVLIGLAITCMAHAAQAASSADRSGIRHRIYCNNGGCYDMRMSRYVDKSDVFRSSFAPEFSYAISIRPMSISHPSSRRPQRGHRHR